MAESGQTFIKKFVGFSLVTWVSFILSFFTAPISTRLFDPEVLGKINIFITYSTLVSSLILIGLDQAYVRFFNEVPGGKSRKYLFTFCFAVTYAVFFVIIVLSVPFRDFLSLKLFEESDNFLLLLFFFFVATSSALRFLNLSYRMEQNVKMYSIQGILIALVSKVLYIGAGFWDASYKPALVVLVASYLLLTVIFMFVQRNRFCSLNEEIDKVFNREVFKFALPLMPVCVVVWANSSIPQLVIQHYLDFSSVGIFASATALASVILVIQQGFNTFWAPYLYENYKTQDGQFFKVHKYLICALTVFALLLVASQDVVFLLLGPKYRAAKSFFPFLILTPVCYSIGETTGMGIGIAKKTGYSLMISIISVLLNLVLCILFQKWLGITGVAIACAISAVVSMIIRTYIGERFYKAITSYKYLLFSIVSITVSAIITLFVDSLYFRISMLIILLAYSFFFFRKEIVELYRYGINFLISLKNR